MGIFAILFPDGDLSCHPNYVTYLLQEHNVSVAEFRQYIETIPKDMYTKCKKPYVLEMYDLFCKKRAQNDGK